MGKGEEKTEQFHSMTIGQKELDQCADDHGIAAEGRVTEQQIQRAVVSCIERRQGR